MAVPCKATGYGNNSVARNVFGFKIGASDALSSLIKYECYDNDQTFPAVDTVMTTSNDIFVGTSGNSNKSMICLVDTSNAAPTSAWKPASATAGEANPNRMKGQTNYVEQDGSVLSNDGRATFNMVIEIPSDATTAMAMGFDLLVRYTYTQSSAPTVSFQINEGTEGTPTWTTLTPGTHGIKHCRSGSSSSDCYANIPESSTEDTAEAWALTA